MSDTESKTESMPPLRNLSEMEPSASEDESNNSDSDESVDTWYDALSLLDDLDSDSEDENDAVLTHKSVWTTCLIIQNT